MMRVSWRIHGLLKNIERHWRKPFKRWQKPANHRHKKLSNKFLGSVFLSFSSIGVLKLCKSFGKYFSYIPVYFRKINHEWVCNTRGVFTWRLQKYINNKVYCLQDWDINEKAETFEHYTYGKSTNRPRLKIYTFLDITFVNGNSNHSGRKLWQIKDACRTFVSCV